MNIFNDNRVVLTFDDGYLDNWVAVMPLLRKYGQKAIIFMSTDFIDPTSQSRPTLDEGVPRSVPTLDRHGRHDDSTSGEQMVQTQPLADLTCASP